MAKRQQGRIPLGRGGRHASVEYRETRTETPESSPGRRGPPRRQPSASKQGPEHTPTRAVGQAREGPTHAAIARRGRCKAEGPGGRGRGRARAWRQGMDCGQLQQSDKAVIAGEDGDLQRSLLRSGDAAGGGALEPTIAGCHEACRLGALIGAAREPPRGEV
jgi:hypothetical protein